ncbi:DMT family transporter [Candidatus Pacearchaeota archaeon]|jgi:drug/metabolite transporter (DMT)-like permease|nr:DMT family transporter [Candidatus Pacearchaeota archaeon]
MIAQTIPFLGSLALASGTVLERYILKKKKLGIKLYQTVSFFAISLITIPFLFFFWKMNAQAFELKNVLIFLSVIASAITANLFVFYSLKWEKVTNLEPARILEPMFTILLALIFSLFISGFSDPNPKILIPALIASVALVFPFIKKERICINKYFVAAILGSFFFGLELILSNLILNFYSPITFYFFRCLSIFIISLVVFHPKTKAMDKKSLLLTFITAAVWVVYRVAIYFGYQNYGVIFTTLVIMLGPIFIYILANRFLKEKLNWRNIVSSLVIIACVIYATIF